MENYSHQSYPDSGDSSPLSREIDCENHHSSWDDHSAAYKVKFMCSYGGKIQPRQHDNQLSYVGGETKILSVDRSTGFSAVLAKLGSLCDLPPSEVSFKYQLPGEDLDALITVANDEDLEHMMMEYDRLNRSSPKPARLRIFLFRVAPKSNSEEYGFKETKPEGAWLVDALNSAQMRPLEDSSPPPPANPEPTNPDFLFGFDKNMAYKVANPNPNSANNVSNSNNQAIQPPAGEPVASIQSQMERFRVSDHGETQKFYEDVHPNANNARIYQNDQYKVQENTPPAPPPQSAPVPVSTGYWPERQVSAGNYPVPGGIPADQQPLYVFQTPSGGLYHQNPSVRPVASQQAYYSVPPQFPPEAYRENPAYNAAPPIQQHRVASVQPPLPPAPAMVPEQGYAQVSYDSTGRPFYYTVGGGGLAPPQYQVVGPAAGVVGDGRAAAAGGVGMAHDSKVVGVKAPQTSSV